MLIKLHILSFILHLHAPAEAVRYTFTVAKNEYDRGILICGTGLGVSMAANKVKGVLAALITDSYSAARARKSNDAKVACFGAFTLGSKVIENYVEIFLTAEFDTASSSAPKVNAIYDVEYEQL